MMVAFLTIVVVLRPVMLASIEFQCVGSQENKVFYLDHQQRMLTRVHNLGIFLLLQKDIVHAQFVLDGNHLGCGQMTGY